MYKYICYVKCINFYYNELFVTRFILTFMKTDSCNLKLHSLIHFYFTLLRVMNVDSEVRSIGMVPHCVFYHFARPDSGSRFATEPQYKF